MSYLSTERNIFNVQTNISNSPTSQGSSTSWLDLEASDITYNCYDNPGFVIYEYTTSLFYNTTSGTFDFKLVQYNTSTSSWEDVDDSQQFSWGLNSSPAYPAEFKTFTFILSGWSGNKQLKTQWKAIAGSGTAQYTYSFNIDGSGSYYSPKPFLEIKSIK